METDCRETRTKAESPGKETTAITWVRVANGSDRSGSRASVGRWLDPGYI